MKYKQRKGEYYITCFRPNLGNNHFFEKVKGNIFEVDDGNTTWKFGIHKAKDGYVITDIASGIRAGDYYKLKREAMKFFEENEQAILDKVNKYMNSDKAYRNFVMELEKIFEKENNHD